MPSFEPGLAFQPKTQKKFSYSPMSSLSGSRGSSNRPDTAPLAPKNSRRRFTDDAKQPLRFATLHGNTVYGEHEKALKKARDSMRKEKLSQKLKFLAHQAEQHHTSLQNDIKEAKFNSERETLTARTQMRSLNQDRAANRAIQRRCKQDIISATKASVHAARGGASKNRQMDAARRLIQRARWQSERSSGKIKSLYNPKDSFLRTFATSKTKSHGGHREGSPVSLLTPFLSPKSTSVDQDNPLGGERRMSSQFQKKPVRPLGEDLQPKHKNHVNDILSRTVSCGLANSIKVAEIREEHSDLMRGGKSKRLSLASHKFHWDKWLEKRHKTSKSSLSSKALQRLRLMFSILDAERNNYVDVENVLRILAERGIKLSVQELRSLLCIRTDLSGKLTFDEFVNGITSPGEWNRLISVRRGRGTSDSASHSFLPTNLWIPAVHRMRLLAKFRNVKVVNRVGLLSSPPEDDQALQDRWRKLQVRNSDQARRERRSKMLVTESPHTFESTKGFRAGLKRDLWDFDNGRLRQSITIVRDAFKPTILGELYRKKMAERSKEFEQPVQLSWKLSLLERVRQEREAAMRLSKAEENLQNDQGSRFGYF